MKNSHKISPVDLSSLRGLSTHAESHWLTFATAMKCYASKPKRSKYRIDRAIERHGPHWLRSALHANSNTHRPITRSRPPELDPETGSLSFLTAGAEKALKPPASARTDSENENPPFDGGSSADSPEPPGKRERKPVSISS